MNEELYSSSWVTRIPIDIENTLMGKEMSCLIDCIAGVDTIQPYCDVSFRVINRIADVLMARSFIFENPIDESKDTIDVLMKF